MAKRLKRNRVGSVILPTGETISKREAEALRLAVNSANARRNRHLQNLKGKAKIEYNDFGIENDFVWRKRSKSLNQFSSKKQFNDYLAKTRDISSGRFEKRRDAVYKENYMLTILDQFNSDGYVLVDKIRSMSDKQFSNLVQEGKIEAIGYLYMTFAEKQERLEKIADQLGVNIDTVVTKEMSKDIKEWEKLTLKRVRHKNLVTRRSTRV